MPATLFVPLSKYLGHSFRPDVDYVDGHLEERSLGERDHGDLQYFFASYINTRHDQWSLRAVVELRVQVRPTRFRVPDICVLDSRAPREQIVVTPPPLRIEILSPEDTIQRTRKRAEDFFLMGVPEVWIVDPATRTVFICDADIITERSEGTLTLEGTPIAIPISAVFAVLDEA